jgi:threonyl-tRNA synthetase
VPRVRLVGPEGEQIGIKDTKEALEFAYSKNLDLVEVAKDADPPVAKVMDYGKWRYEQEQRAKLARKHQSTINIKEIKLRPKIDLHMLDVLGRSWQMGTIQLDGLMPKQFGLSYMGADNVEHTPYVVHRALLGSLERFMGILIEHYGGAFPSWLAPVQVRVLPVADTHRDEVHGLVAQFDDSGVRADVDERDETLGKRIRDAELAKIPYVVVWGDRETPAAIAVRARGGEGVTTLSLDELVARIADETPS